jgi:hypothetical protein
MRTILQFTKQNSVSRTRLIVLVVLLVLSSIGMFGQNSKQEGILVLCNSEITITSSDETVITNPNTETKANSDLNFVSWFMGTKQAPKTNFINNSSPNSKRQIINSGIAPNGLLLKVFLKKAINYHSTVA